MSEIFTSDGTLISYDDIGDSADVAILLHGFGCDRTFLAPQAAHLAELGFRVISPDLKGHGLSAAPQGDYSIKTLGAEITELIYQLGLAKVFLIGHSMGGNVGLSVAASTPVSRGLVFIDSAVFASTELLESLAPLPDLFLGPESKQVYRQVMASLLIPADDPKVRATVLAKTPVAPGHVLESCLRAHFAQNDFAQNIAGLSTPLAYIGASSPLGDMQALRCAAPHAFLGQTLASGHFSPLTVSNQINAMIESFIGAVQRTSARNESVS